MYFFLTNLLFISTSKWSYLWIYLFMVSMSQMYVHSFVRDIYKLFKHIYEGWLLIYYLILICIFFLLGTGTVIKTHNCYSYFKWGTGMLTRFEKNLLFIAGYIAQIKSLDIRLIINWFDWLGNITNNFQSKFISLDTICKLLELKRK